MSESFPTRFGVLVIGGGPAGMAAAVRAAECGTRVGIIDDNPAPGGQIWRSAAGEKKPEEFMHWRENLDRQPVARMYGLRVFDQPVPGILFAEGQNGHFELHYHRLVLATGARERFLPFPGWTLPNVMGAGGLQAMAKSGLPIRGKNVVVAGTGPLLLAVAAYLRKHGAEIPIICEQASWAQLARFSLVLLAEPQRIAQAAKLKRELAGVRFAANSWPTAAHGHDALESVTISHSGKTETIGCDCLACGFHLVPNAELAALLGCALDSGFVRVDEFQQTTVADVFCAGEPTGIGGVELSLLEGQIAGFAAAGNAEKARELFRARSKAQRFARSMYRAFCLRPELARLCSPETVVCRCEDVTYSRLTRQPSWRAAKLQTRCGMGPCQGRVCGAAAEFLFGWKCESVRPPIFPARIESLGRPELSPETTAITGSQP